MRGMRTKCICSIARGNLRTRDIGLITVHASYTMLDHNSWQLPHALLHGVAPV